MEEEKRILLVDDMAVNLKILNEILGNEYNISVATNGKEALEICASHPPDLILLDIIMPEMNGYEVCRRLKAAESTRDIPIIFVSSMNEVNEETKGLSLGAVDFISKPARPAIVKARVQNQLKIKDQHDQLKHSISLLQHETEILQQKAELGLQAAGLAHDLNNVLNGVLAIEMIPSQLAADPPKTDQINLDIECALESIKMGCKICQGFTCYLRDIEQEKKVHPVLPLLQPLDIYCRKFTGEVVREFQADLPPITCKGYQIKRVLVNLFINATQAIAGQDEAIIRLRAWSENKLVHLAIEDNGPGIAKNILPHIFKERYTTKKTGTGLGLFIVKSIIADHDGTIAAETTEGEGSTFTVSLPVAPAGWERMSL